MPSFYRGARFYRCNNREASCCQHSFRETQCCQSNCSKGLHIPDGDTPLRIATEVGLDAAAFRETCDTRPARDLVRRACDQASARGVRGVPFFIVHGAENKEPIGFSGAVDATELLKIFHEVI